MKLYLAFSISGPQISKDDILGIPTGPSINITSYPSVFRYLDELVDHCLEFCFRPLTHIVSLSIPHSPN